MAAYYFKLNGLCIESLLNKRWAHKIALIMSQPEKCNLSWAMSPREIITQNMWLYTQAEKCKYLY